MAPNDSKMAPELLTELKPAEQRRNKRHNRCTSVWMEFSLCKLTQCQNLSCCPLAWCAWIRKQRKLTESESTNSGPLFAANSQLHHRYGHTCKNAATQEHAERQRAAVDKWQSPSSPPSIPLFIYTCWLCGSGCLWVVLGEMGGLGACWVRIQPGYSLPGWLIWKWEGKQRLPRQQLAGGVGCWQI